MPGQGPEVHRATLAGAVPARAAQDVVEEVHSVTLTSPAEKAPAASSRAAPNSSMDSPSLLVKGMSAASVTGEVRIPLETETPHGGIRRLSSPYNAGEGEGNSFDDDPEAAPWLKNYEKKGFQAASLLPVVTWVPAYVRALCGRPTEEDRARIGHLPYSLKGDLIAGFTVGFMLVPQCLAFAMLAGLPVQTGLYASFAPLVVYSLLGTIRQVQTGPTALMSLLTGQALDSLGYADPAARIQGAALLALGVGAVSLFLGAIRFGFIVDFMSHSVMTAFCSAAGVTIATSQLKHLVGISMPRKKYWWKTVSYLATHLDETDGPTLAMGGSLLFVLVFLKQWKSAGSKEARGKHRLWRCFPKDRSSAAFKALKVVADMSSLLSVLIGWFWGLLYRVGGVDSVRLVGEVDSSGFRLIFPELDGDGVSGMAVSAVIMAVVGFLETMAVGGKFAMQARYEYDPNQELLALGCANVAGAVMSGYPTTGSFSRTAVNAMFGATSLVACAVSSLLVLCAVLFLLPVVAKLPLASLAPIIIQGAFGVIAFDDFKVAYRASKRELGVMLATFSVSLALSVKEGLLVGFVLSVMKTMHELANPNMVVCGRIHDGTFRDLRNFPRATVLPTAVVVRMDARLSFTNARKLKEFCLKASTVRELDGDTINFVVIDGKSINHVDLTGCEMLEMLAESLESRNQRLIVANLKGPVSKCLASAGLPPKLRKHGGCLSIDMDQAIDIVNGADTNLATETFDQLLGRVHTVDRMLHAQAASRYVCNHKGTPTSGYWSPRGSAPSSPRNSADRQVSPSLEEAQVKERPVPTLQPPPMPQRATAALKQAAAGARKQDTEEQLVPSLAKPGRGAARSSWDGLLTCLNSLSPFKAQAARRAQ